MAKGKKINNTIDNDFDFDTSLDFDDLDFSADPFKDDRKPVTKIKDGLKSGIKSKASDSSFIAGTLKELLPKAFGDSLDMGATVAKNVRQLYSEAANEVRPAIGDFKRVAAKLAPKDSKYVPDPVKQLLKRWQEETTSKGSDLKASNQRDDLISLQLGQIFEQQFAQTEKDKREEQSKDYIKEGIELSRHRDLFTVLNQSHISLSRISQYQTTVNLKYQKKSLELQHRQLFAQYDILEILSKSHALHTDALGKVVKNTALPDWQKINIDELGKQKLFNKFADGVGNSFKSMFPTFDVYTSMVTERVRNRTMGALKENLLGFRSGLSEAEVAKEQTAGATDGIDKYEMGASVAGEMATDTLGYRAARKLKDPLRKAFPKIDQYGDYLENFNENIVGSAEKFRTDRKWDAMTGPKAWLARAAQSLLPSLGMNKSFDRISDKDLVGARPFTLKTERSINEIIPGYLSRILQEMQIIRTGNPNIDRTEYDQNSGKFTSRTKLLKTIAGGLYSRKNAKRTSDILETVVNEIDPENKLTTQERESLKKTLLKNRVEYKKTDANLEGTAGELTRSYLSSIEKDDKSKLLLNRRLNSLVAGMSDPRAKAESLISKGQANELVQLGIIKRTDNGYELNTDTFYKGQLGGDAFNPLAKRKKSAIPKGFNPVSAPSAGLSYSGDNIDLYSDRLDKITDRLDTAIEQRREVIALIKTITNIKQRRADADGSDTVDYSGTKQRTKAQYGRFKDYLSKGKTKLSEGMGAVKSKAQELYESDEVASSKDKLNKLRDKVINTKSSDLFREAIKGIKDKWEELYVRGESEPRILKAKLRAGHYVDVATGKVINSLEQIKGAIKDIVTDNVVLSSDELEHTYVKDKDGLFKQFYGYIKDSVENLYNRAKSTKVGSVTLGYLEKAWSAVKENASMIRSIAYAAKDVWVVGEKYPRMTAVKMQQGHYSDAISGKIIYLPSEIVGEVKDNNGQTVIGADELDKLMVYEGRSRRFAPIRKALRAIGSVADAVSWYYKKIGIPLTKFNFKMIAKAASVAMKTTAWAFGTGPYSVKDVYVAGEPEPRLHAIKLKNGEYFNKSDGKPIYHQKDINGEVIDANGSTLIFEDELQNLKVYNSVLGLFNPFKPLKWIGQKVSSVASWAIKKGLKATKFLTRAIGTTLMGVTSGAIRYLSKPEDVYVKGEPEPRLRAVLMKAGRYISEKTGNIISLPSDIDGPVWDQQEEIRVINKEDLEKGLVKQNGESLKTTVVQDIISGFKKINKLFSYKTKLKIGEPLKPDTSLADKGLSAQEETVSLLGDIKGLFEDYFTKKEVKGDTDQDGDREGSWEDIKQKRDAQREKKPADKEKPKDEKSAKKDGLMSILGTALEAITSFLGGFKGLFKAGGLLAGAGKLLGIGKAVAATGTAAASIGAGAGTLGAIGATVAAVVTSPVTLGIAGTALAGYGAYRGFKALRKWMSKPSPVDTIRYTQYGFKKDDTSYFSKIVELEEYMKQFVKISSEQAELEEKKMDIKEMMSIFGFSSDNNDHKKIFGTWYYKRFKPVYLTHVSALNLINGSADLSKLNDLKREEKLKYVEATKFPSGPYNVTTIPVLSGDVTAANAADVSAAVQAAIDSLGVKQGRVTQSSAIQAKTNKQNEDTRNGKLNYDNNKDADKLPGRSISGSSSIASAPSLNTVSAFDTIRYKTYGLKELDKSRVLSLVMLESFALKKLVYKGDTAEFEGNPVELLDKTSAYFGIADLFGEKASVWVKWFRDRFLPVYLNYATLYLRSTNKQLKSGSAVLDPNQQYDIALALSSTASAWRVSDSPWQGYDLNTNPDTIKSNLEFLKSLVKEKAIAEQTKEPATKQETVASAANPTVSTLTTPSASKQPTVAASGTTGPVVSTTSPTTQGSTGATVSSATKPPSSEASPGMGPVAPAVSGIGDKPDPTVKVPDPTGSGIGGLKETVASAAKVVGIDPNIMLTTAAIESDFNPNAKAKTSSASGLMQFINSTWKETISKHGSKYGYDASTSPFDAKASALMGAHYIKDSLSHLGKSYKGAIGSVEAYLVHFMGPGGAAKFLKAMQENPGQYGSQLMPKEAAANQSIYFGKSGPRTLGEIYQLFYDKVRAKAAKYGIQLPVRSGADTSEKAKHVMPGAGQNTGVVSEASKPSSTTTVSAPTAAVSGDSSDNAAVPGAAPYTTPKSPYNPSTRAQAVQQKVQEASRQATTPLSDAVGFNPKTMGTSTETTNASKNTLTADIMKTTETVLAQSLDVQKETLQVMKMIYEKINSGAPAAPSAAQPSGEAKKYEAPKAPVPMRKSA